MAKYKKFLANEKERVTAEKDKRAEAERELQAAQARVGALEDEKEALATLVKQLQDAAREGNRQAIGALFAQTRAAGAPADEEEDPIETPEGIYNKHPPRKPPVQRLALRVAGAL